MQSWEVVITYKNGSSDRAFINSLDHALDSIRNMNVAVGEDIQSVKVTLITLHAKPTRQWIGVGHDPSGNQY